MTINSSQIDSLSRQTVPKLVIMNGHGRNDFRTIIRELQPKFPHIFICTVDWYKKDSNILTRLFTEQESSSSISRLVIAMHYMNNEHGFITGYWLLATGCWLII